MSEINLLSKYPKTKRNLKEASINRTDKERQVARRFDREFFDGNRRHGYGGYIYNEKFWTEVVKDFVDYFKLQNGSRILDVGCGKGFMVYDFKRLYPNFEVKGIDISEYAIKNGMNEIKNEISVGSCESIPFEDNYFDLVISINTIHNLEKDGCAKSLKEICRVSKKHKFIIVDAYSNNLEKERMFAWNLTAKTIMHRDDWIDFFEKNNYDGDYYWFTP